MSQLRQSSILAHNSRARSLDGKVDVCLKGYLRKLGPICRQAAKKRVHVLAIGLIVLWHDNGSRRWV